MKIVITERQTKKLVDNIVNEGTVYQNLTSFLGGLSGRNVGPSNDYSGFDPVIPDGSEMMNPLGNRARISSNFGQRNGAVGTKNHKGVDLSTPSGSKVYAPADGEVLEAKDTTPNGCGGFIMLDHGNMKTKFCHLKQWVVNKGETVKRGQLIGYSGGAKSDPYRGTSTGPHLHYEILNSDGIAMNPTTVQSNLG